MCIFGISILLLSWHKSIISNITASANLCGIAHWQCVKMNLNFSLCVLLFVDCVVSHIDHINRMLWKQTLNYHRFCAKSQCKIWEHENSVQQHIEVNSHKLLLQAEIYACEWSMCKWYQNRVLNIHSYWWWACQCCKIYSRLRSYWQSKNMYCTRRVQLNRTHTRRHNTKQWIRSMLRYATVPYFVCNITTKTIAFRQLLRISFRNSFYFLASCTILWTLCSCSSCIEIMARRRSLLTKMQHYLQQSIFSQFHKILSKYRLSWNSNS